MAESKFCAWCQNEKGKTDITFSIIDANIAQYVPNTLISFCPFCGRELHPKKEKDNG